MSFIKFLLLFLTATISAVAGREDKDGPVIGTHQSPFPEPQPTTVTIDRIYPTGYEVSGSVTVAGGAPQTTVCSQRCSVMTLSTVVRYVR